MIQIYEYLISHTRVYQGMLVKTLSAPPNVWIYQGSIENRSPPVQHIRTLSVLDCTGPLKHIFYSKNILEGLSTGHLRIFHSFRFMNLWGIAQWDNSSEYKHYFRKLPKSNLICSKIYININIFWSVEQKVIVLTTLRFIGFLLVLKKEDFVSFVYVQKYFMKHIFVEGTYGFYSQFIFACIIGYIIFKFKHNFFEWTYKIFFHSVVWGKNR